MGRPAVIIGGSVASLVAAIAAAGAGRRVELYCDPAGAGGSFAGVSLAGRRMDLGVRLFELDYEGDDRRQISALRPEEDGHRPFIDDIAGFVREICGDALVRAREPEMWIEGRLTRCVLMTVDLSDLPSVLSDGDRASIAREIAALPEPGPLGGDDTLPQASLERHGRLLHRLLVEHPCGKLWEGWSETLAVERRKLWSALFHPRTLREAFAHEPISFRPHRPFATIGPGQAYRFVDCLLRLIEESPLISVWPCAIPSHLSMADGTVTIDFGTGDRRSWPAETVALGLAPERLFRAAAIPFEQERMGASIMWVEAAEEDVRHAPSCLTVADPALLPFRISPAGLGMFAIEFGRAEPCMAAARAALEQTGMVREGANLHVVHQLTGPGQTAPTRANRVRFDAALEQFRSLGFGGTVLGAARRFGWGSLNDQIADGLYYGAAQC